MKKIIKLFNNYKKYFFISNIGMFIIKVILFLLTKSFSFLIYSFYSLCIGLTKKNVFFNKKENYRVVGILLLLSSILFVNYSLYVIKTHYISNYNMYLSIGIAAFVFYDIGLSIYGIVKSNKENNIQNKIYKLTCLATSFISLELVQTSILSFTNKGLDMSLYNGIGGIMFGICSLLVSIRIMMINNIKK